MQKQFFLSSLALALFIICPRMAGMVYMLSRHTNVPLLTTTLMGSIIAIPFILMMVYIFAKYGLYGALAFCILTDFASAVLMQQISMKAGLETFIIALFVIIGVKLAPYISNFLLNGFN